MTPPSPPPVGGDEELFQTINKLVYDYNGHYINQLKPEIMQLITTYVESKVKDGRAQQIMLDFLSIVDEFDTDEGDLIEWREDSLRVLNHSHETSEL